MMNTLQTQKGFLSIVSVIIVVIIGLITTIAAYQFTTDSRSASTELASTQAYYMAMAGLQRAEHAIATNGATCTSINGTSDYTNASFTNAPGVFTVTGATNNATTTLNGAITASSNSITLTNSSGFANQGVVEIDNEFISYNGISGNTLNNIIRGVAGTSATAHVNGQAVIQNQCVLTATGGVPNLNAFTASVSPNGRRILQTILAGNYFSLNNNGVAFSPLITSVGNISLSGNGIVTNSSVTSSSSNFSGSTIVTAGTASLSGNGKTQVSNGSGGVVTSSSAGNIKADIQQNVSSLTTSNLFSKFFSQSKSSIQSLANKSYNSSNIKGVTGKLIWINSGGLTLSSGTVGSATSPDIIIVNGNVSISGSTIIYGFIYATGTVTLSGGSSGVIGTVVSERTVSISGQGSGYSTDVLNRSGGLGGTNLSTQYATNAAVIQEVNP